MAVRAIPTVGPSLGMRAILVGKAKWNPQKPTPHGEQRAGDTPILNVHSRPGPAETKDPGRTRLPQAWLTSGSLGMSLPLVAAVPQGTQVHGSCPLIWRTQKGPGVVTHTWHPWCSRCPPLSLMTPWTCWGQHSGLHHQWGMSGPAQEHGSTHPFTNLTLTGRAVGTSSLVRPVHLRD